MAAPASATVGMRAAAKSARLGALLVMGLVSYATPMDTPAVDWTRIDTVLLDMDGTLLDLRFDNWFWQELVPGLYAAAHGLSLPEAVLRLGPKFRETRGTIQWYCVDHWSREL